ncbi:MAG: porin family protein, partial [Flavitalea sp.]
MKNIYVAVIIFLGLAQVSYSQLRVAALGGIQSSSVTEKNSLAGWETNIKPGYSSRSGVHLGVLVEVPLSASGHLFFHPGILYTAKGRKFSLKNDTATAIATDTISTSHNFSVNYIEFPLNLTYKIPLNNKISFLISAGPYVGFFYNGKQKSEARIYSSNKFKEDEFALESGNEEGKIKTVDMGLNARAGLEIGNVWITGFASKGLTSFY